MSSHHHSGPDSSSEAELQAELRSLFRIDTQTYLERYGQVAEHLTADSWAGDIQELYRCIHTIKGGAVTVGAEAMLALATALEDILSALRFVEDAPSLGDRQLIEVLVEAGELVGAAPDWANGSLEGGISQDSAVQLAPMLARLNHLHDRIRAEYLQPDWNEHSQLFYEFAEQGFDLVVLDLEMGLERAPKTGPVDDQLIASARATLDQLSGIGRDLEMAAGWETLLNEGRGLLSRRDLETWQAAWPQYLVRLKGCAKVGGQQPAPLPDRSHPQPEAITTIADLFDEGTAIENSSIDELGIDEFPASQSSSQSSAAANPALFPGSGDTDWVDLFPAEPFHETSLADVPESSEELPSPQIGDRNLPQDDQLSETRSADVQVPIPLERLDRCAQQMVATIQALRTSQQRYMSLRERLLPLLALARESVQSIAQLRQLQTDYTLLSTVGNRAVRDGSRASGGPSPERYRQGYLTINRLLEHSLRLTELGAEAEQFVRQTGTSFQALERNIQQLKTTVEESRLVPFRTLAFRARAILRDLTTRYAKPARLVVEGEQLALDAGTIRRLEPLLLHLLRNAFDHGLESPEIRTALGKNPEGTIHLSLQRRGNRFQLCVRDDGGGIDPEAIAATASAKHLPDRDLSTPEGILNILTHPGFSSKATANEISGRGVGLDVVQQQVNALDGRMSLETAIDRGTAFHIDLPVPHLLVRCIVVQSDHQQFAIPADDIALTALADQLTEVTEIPSQPGKNESNQISCLAGDSGLQAVSKWVAGDGAGSPPVPMLDLYQQWQGLPARTAPPTAICLRVDRPAGATVDSVPHVWLLVDDLIEQVDLPVEELPAPMVAPAGVLGVSVQGDGHLIPVLDVNALWRQIIEPRSHAFATAVNLPSPLPSEPTSTDLAAPDTRSASRLGAAKHVLIVDDAALMRRRMEASLTASGYRVTTKQDGLDAWNWLQENELPDLVVSDIEMPQMDGFTLLARCRAANYTMPFLVVSSRLSEEWNHEAIRLGATDYLTKGFSTPELLQRVQSALSSAPQLA